MKNKVLLSVLAASLAMNFGVAAMFGLRLLQARSVDNAKGCPFVSNDERLYAMLGLSPEQLASIKPLAEQFHTNMNKLSTEIHGKRDSLMTMMEQDGVDMDLVNQARQDILSLQSMLQQKVFAHILQIKQILSPDQKQLFFQTMRRSFIQQNLNGSQ